MLNIKKIADGSALTVVLEGRLDTSSSPRLDAELRGALDGVTSLVLDLAGLEYISSAGLRVFLYAYKVMKRQGSMKLVHVNDVIYGIFEVSGFIDILTVQRAADRPEDGEPGKDLVPEDFRHFFDSHRRLWVDAEWIIIRIGVMMDLSKWILLTLKIGIIHDDAHAEKLTVGIVGLFPAVF